MAFIHVDVADIFEIKYDITLNNTVEFNEQLKIFVRSLGSNLILDLNKANYVNNSALRIIAKAAIEAIKVNKELVIAGIRPQISEIFEIVQFNNFIKIFTTYEEAINYFYSKSGQN